MGRRRSLASRQTIAGKVPEAVLIERLQLAGCGLSWMARRRTAPAAEEPLTEQGSSRLVAVVRMPLPAVCVADKRIFASAYKSPGYLRRFRNELAMLLVNAAH